MTTLALGRADAWNPREDRKIYLVWVAINWAGMIAGFGSDFPRYLAKKPSAPLLVHVHAAVFVLWLFVQTAQIVLVTRGDIRLHRRLGVYALGLAALMVVLGLATALTSRFQVLESPHSHPQFLAVNLVDIIPFGLLTLAGYLLRRDPASHKRLMMLAMVAITDPGFSRFGDVFLPEMTGFWPNFFAGFYGNVLLIGLMAGWDIWRRGALNGAFAVAAPLLLGGEAVAVLLLDNPAWKEIATGLVRAWGYGG